MAKKYLFVGCALLYMWVVGDILGLPLIDNVFASFFFGVAAFVWMFYKFKGKEQCTNS